MILKKMVDVVLQNDTKREHERDYLMLSIDSKFADQVRTMIESSTCKWVRKDSENSDKIITNFKCKRKKRLEKLNAYYLKEDLR